MMLVVLRLALGWHFLYEGVWKVTHHDAFLAETEGFLSAARGPAAGFFNGLVPDIDGHRRLEHDLGLVDVKDPDVAKGSPAKQPRLATRWEKTRKDFVAYYRPGAGKDEIDGLYKQFAEAAKKVCQRHIHGLEEFVKENGDKIKAHFESLRRYEEQLTADPSTDFMRQRRWDQLQEYRKEAKGWATDLEDREKALKADLMDLLDGHRKKEMEAVAAADAKDERAKEGKGAAAAKKDSSNTQGVQSPNASDGKTTGSTKSKSSPGPKPADPPRDLSTSFFGPLNGSDWSRPIAGQDVVFVTWDELQAKSHSTENNKPKPKAKPDTKPSPAAAVAVDFSPLAEGRDPAGPFRVSRNPFTWPQMEQLTFVLGYGMLAIGFCLMIGLFTRLSALAGAAFMLAWC